ncbi:cilia- and flagella-associated protein 184 [Tiliqua scincoides]|uniref:cilia- and flagella-associated protein 184 n=1 Tax=Tiliqua scincoides TaxID=71010 RepID=UPI003461A92A
MEAAEDGPGTGAGEILPASSSEAAAEEPQPTAEGEAEETKEEAAVSGGEVAGESPAGEEAGERPAEEQPPPSPPPEEGAAASEEPPLEEEAAEEEEGGGEEAPAAEDGAFPEGEADAAPAAEAAPEAEASSSLPELQMPTSRTFSVGEPEEPPPLQVGVPLGRRISQSLRELELERHSRLSLSPGLSPESAESLEEETEEEIEARRAEEQRQRAELVEQYRQLVSERGRLRRYNSKLQCKLAELLNKAKGKERARAELEQHISDKEQRYSRYLAMLQDLRGQQEQEMAWYQQQITTLRKSCDEKLAKVDGQWKAHQAIKKEVAVFTMGRRLGGKQAAVKQVEQIQKKELSKEREVTEVRLENIKLKHRIQRLEASLKAQEELAEGLHLIDFEQLKIENQTYNEKIEERNEELQKLRRKITNTVQVLTQVKEKLQFVEAKNQSQKAQLLAVEALVAQRRDLLTRTKQARDRLRMDNEKLQQRCGLLGNRLLLRDFEDKVDAAEILNTRLEHLKHHHAGLTLACQGVKKKIRGVRSFLPL